MPAMADGIEDVARRAGVSTATVSRALRGLPSVSPRTRALVQAAADEIGYVPTPSASSLASGRTSTVAVLTPWVTRWYFGQVIEGVERTLHAAHLDALLYILDADRRPQPLRFDPAALRRRVDGSIVVGLPLERAELAALESLGIPIVGIGAGDPAHPLVRLDDVGAARAAVAHLADLGHRVIGLLAGSPDDDIPWSPGYLRRVGWQQELAARGLDADASLVRDGEFSLTGGRRAAHALLDLRPDVTAVFAASDEMAMGVLLAAEDRGLRVPAQLSLVGFDGHELGPVVGLTTIAQDALQQGVDAAALLLELMAGREVPACTLYPTHLVVRRTTGPVPA